MALKPVFSRVFAIRVPDYTYPKPMKRIAAGLFGLFPSMLLTAQTDSADFYYRKGMEEKSLQRPMMASRSFDKAIRFDNRHVDAYLANGFAQLDMRKTDEAIRYFTKVLELNPANQSARAALMELYFNYRQFDQAIKLAADCKSCPGSDRILGMCYYHREDYGNAIRLLQPLVKKNSTDTEAAYVLGRSYLDLEDYKNAIPCYLLAIQGNQPKKERVYELGMLYYTVQDFKNAVSFFNKAAELGLNPTNDFLENLGYAYIYAGNPDKGEEVLKTVIAKRPGNTQFVRDIAHALYESRNYDKALNFCQKLLEADSKDAKALYLAGMCFQQKGDKEKGQAMCDKAIDMDPSLNRLRSKKMDLGNL